ncbi:MAG: NosD domain-containing protein [Patescibacteria group bacterium]
MNKIIKIFKTKNSRRKILTVIFLLICLTFLINTANAQEYNIPGAIEGEGTHFEITDSEYLNIVLDSSESIKIRMESIPEMLTMMIEPVSSSTLSTQIILSDFVPQKTYYKYQNDYHNLTEFTADENGSYFYIQDLLKPHFVFIQTKKSTKFISDDATGGDCYLIGNWDLTTKTCVLTQDIFEVIQIDSNNITLNGDGHKITGNNNGFGVYLYQKTGVTIKNLNVQKFLYGIYISSSNNNILTNNIALNNFDGIVLDKSFNNTITNNTASNNNYFGIILSISSNNILTNNIAQENRYDDVYIGAWSDNHCNNSITNTIGSGGRQIKYFSSAVNLSNENLSELILCNADGSNINNIIINGSAVFKNNGLFLILTDSSIIANINSSNHYSGIYVSRSNNNTLIDNTASNNDYDGIVIDNSFNNTLINNIASNNNRYGILFYHSGSNILTSSAILNNFHGIYFTSSNNNQIYNNNFINNQTQINAYISNNIFNLSSPIGGNYWSDFDELTEGCIDLNSNNFCDFSYVFTGGQDNYPWTIQNGWATNQQPIFSNLNQYKSDGETLINESGITTEDTAVFKATLNDPDNDQAKLQIELKEYNQSFDGQNLLESGFVNSGSEAVVSRSLLVDGQYHWRVRAIDSQGNVSQWQEFGIAGNVDFEVKLVPLYTQGLSPYPSWTKTDEWDGLDYAKGAAGNYRCGSTIAQCGCGITSAVMIGRYYKITESIDKNDVNPGTINKWLKDYNGYQQSENKQINGNIKWDKVIEYLGFLDENGIKMKQLELAYDKTTKDFYKFGNSKIEEYLQSTKPIIAFKKEIGHLFVIDGEIFDSVNTTSTYTIKDPAWYKTTRLNQQKTYDQNGNVEIQGYGNVFANARLFDYLAAPKKITGSITLMLGSPAELLVTDPQGKKLGKDPITNAFYGEIPDGFYTAESILSSESELSEIPDATKILYIAEPLSGQYNVKIIGTNTGSYTFDLLVYDDNGQSLSVVSEGITESNNIQTFELNYSTTTTQETEIYRLVDIDIKPGSDPNSINLKSQGVVPVAILTNQFFNAKEIIIIDSVIFAGAKPVRGNLEDVDSDNDLDLILHFDTQFLNLTPADIEAVLTAKLNDGGLIKGIDPVKIIKK